MFVSDIKELLKLGANVNLVNSKGSHFVSDLKSYAKIAKESGATLTISSNGHFISDLKEISKIAGNNVNIIVIE